MYLMCLTNAEIAPGGGWTDPTPTPSATALPIYRIDEHFNISQVDQAVICNAKSKTIPAAVPCAVDRSGGGLYLATIWGDMGMGGSYQFGQVQQGGKMIGWSPSTPIAVATVGSPTPSAAPVALWRIDGLASPVNPSYYAMPQPGWVLPSFGYIIIYNIDPINAVPANVPVIVEPSPGGHYYVSKYAGKPLPPGPGQLGGPYGTTLMLPGSPVLLGTAITPPGW